MIKKVHGIEYATRFADIYNSANELYPENERYLVDETTFYSQLELNENYIYEENGEFIGFISYQKYEKFYQLTSLYIRITKQKQGVGKALLHFIEHEIPVGSFIITKALNTSIWAIQFYKKNGYVETTKTQRNQINVEQKSWETILCKHTI